MRIHLAVKRGAIGNVIVGQVLSVAQVLRHVARRVAQRLRTARRQQQRRIRLRMRREEGARRPRGFVIRVVGEHRVCIGAAKSEGADADDQAGPVPQFERLGDGLQIPGADIDVRVHRAHMKVRGDAPIAQHMQRFEQARHARGGLEVSNVALDRTDGERIVERAMPAERLTNRARLERITDRGSRAVSFEVIDIGG